MARNATRQVGQAAIGISVAVVLGISSVTLGSEADDAPGPGLCFEAVTSSLGPGAWSDVLDAVSVAVEERPEFFSNANIVHVPDVGEAWEPQSFETVKIGIWSVRADDPRTSDDLRGALAAHECLGSDSMWEVRLSQELLFAAAERILAEARMPDESGEAPIPENATTEIAVDLYPDAGRIRTLLKFNVPVAFFNPGGECWIDDVLVPGEDGATPSSNATDGQQTDPLVGSACDRFRGFMTAGGLGERALTLLPAQVALSDGSMIALEVLEVRVTDDALVLAGAISQ